MAIGMIIGMYRAKGLGVVIVEKEEENKRKWKIKRTLRFSRNDKKILHDLSIL